jgi:formylglycine-generating enzyme required for sulfatase activity
VEELLRTYRDDPDRGLHAAVDWLLRQWQRDEEVKKIDKELATGKVEGKREWYVNGQGQTLAVFRGPVEFLMGPPAQEPNRGADEALHRRRIPRSFALGTKEVTVWQFGVFLQANPGSRHDGRATQTYSPHPDGPIVGVTWFDAARYCNWLSKQEGIPEEEWCYEIENGQVTKLKTDYLSLTGYRLPTEAEWEYACRAGTVTSRHYGAAEEMLGHYAWYVDNAQGRARPVGSKKPNDYGLFDMYGNAWEWCQDALAPYPLGKDGKPSEDRENQNAITPLEHRVLRGGAFTSAPGELRSVSRYELPPNYAYFLAGLRVARTCR